MRDLICFCVVGLIQIGLTSAETCVNWYEGNKECDHGCCGDYGDYDCCFHWKVYAIVGGVIGGLIVLGVIGFLVFFFFFYQKDRQKRQVQPNGGQVLQTYQISYGQTAPPYPGNQTTQPTAPYPAGPQPYPAVPQPYPAGSQPYATGSQMAPPAPPKYVPPENSTYGLQDPAYPPQG